MDERSGNRLARAITRSGEAIHTVAYYSPEIRGFDDDGFSGWWHAYFAARSAPMGRVNAATVVATFYNFAPRMIERAVPSCWDILSPAAVRARQLELVEQAVHRVLVSIPDPHTVPRAAELLRGVSGQLGVGARPLYAAWADEPWPGTDEMDLWHACTLLREFRFDGHNIALAAGGLDPVECHLMMASHGFGNAPTIQKIRGWTSEEWNAAHERLVDRGWLTADGSQTSEGAQVRRNIERHTDELAGDIVRALGDGAEEAAELLDQLRGHLTSTGAVHGVWPPPTVLE